METRLSLRGAAGDEAISWKDKDCLAGLRRNKILDPYRPFVAACHSGRATRAQESRVTDVIPAISLYFAEKLFRKCQESHTNVSEMTFRQKQALKPLVFLYVSYSLLRHAPCAMQARPEGRQNSGLYFQQSTKVLP
jgi:hypothetical protein